MKSPFIALALAIARVASAAGPATSPPAATEDPAPTAAPAVQAPAPAPPPAAPAAPKFGITPYGFVLAQAFWNSGPFSTKDAGFQALTNGDSGSFILSARGSRLGFKVSVPDDPWTGARLNAALEFDFKGGQNPTTATSSCTVSGSNPGPAGVVTCPNSGANSASLNGDLGIGAASTSWYNGLLRLRLAYLTASWGAPESKITLLAGQDWGLIAPLSATSLAWGYDPLFWQAGNLWRRSPQVKVTYEWSAGDLGGTASVAALSPADSALSNPGSLPGYAADYGAGNRSSVPNFEARASVLYRQGKTKLVELGLSGHYDWRAYSPAGATQANTVNGSVLAADLQVNPNPLLTLQGEAFLNDGAGDSVNSIAPAVVTSGSSPDTFAVSTVKSRGLWGQAVLKPAAWIHVPVGYGLEELYDWPSGVSTGQRTSNKVLHGGVILNASNPWKFGVEAVRSTSVYGFQGKEASATQLAFATKLDF